MRRRTNLTACVLLKLVVSWRWVEWWLNVLRRARTRNSENEHPSPSLHDDWKLCCNQSVRVANASLISLQDNRVRRHRYVVGSHLYIKLISIHNILSDVQGYNNYYYWVSRFSRTQLLWHVVVDCLKLCFVKIVFRTNKHYRRSGYRLWVASIRVMIIDQYETK